jgi:hypothetical protein
MLMATCRYCHESGPDDTMLKYSTRANIHARCALIRPPFKDFRTFIFQVSNLGDFPILLIKDDARKLEALRDAFAHRNYEDGFAQMCEDMIRDAEHPADSQTTRVPE